ncbi:helix-turn-helix domain-containing protein [Streptantibioticus ferralitis]|uniref:Helix-turn-helix transcriptional regulator n=1 Tax=Streptantibioticus ferralitis TaxID=236510 RepID=A0ABT5YWX3_9ACTN|nr:helix-turn-helix transcriptional regulator [Streptantibioticus ferralitis]MDF2256107.1 helix-turn-helix transcriptional regulator [Streptantibioticus ferralitis]
MTGSQEHPSLAASLDGLFRGSRPAGRRWTNDEVAAEIKKKYPRIRVSGAYLSALRTGKRTHPSQELQTAIAEFFGVSPAYFVDPDHAQRVSAQLAALEELTQAGVRAVALRAVGLQPESLEAITAVLDQVRKLQGLPPVEE